MKNLNAALAQLKTESRYRSLSLPQGIDLTSNDYLGMSTHPLLRKSAITALQDNMDLGAAGSRLLRGHTHTHESLENFAAHHFNAPKTLFFATGFQANYALFTTLPDRHDLIVYDSLTHASVRDGVQASTAKSIKFPHNDLNALEDLLKRHAHQKIWIAVESVYSMDGDIAPLKEMHTLAHEYNATLIVDEAHGTGIFGHGGKGLCWDIITTNGYNNLITLHTCGKAIGVAGGLVCGDGPVIEYLINRARPFIYSTAPMPLQAYLVQKSLEILASPDGDERRKKLFAICKIAQKLFGGAGTQIIPVIIGDNEKTVMIAQNLQARGYDIRAIRPPTVPEGTSRLRLSLSCLLDANILQELHLALQQIRGDTAL